MVSDESITTLIARPFTLYSLRVVPLWDGDVERIELGNDLPAIIDRITRDRSISGFIGSDLKPMRFCQLEQEEAITLLHSGKTYYARERTPVWKVMVPASGVYSRETILSCMTRVAGRNVEKYENVLFLYPKTREFYSYSSSEIHPVDDTVFVIEHPTR